MKDGAEPISETPAAPSRWARLQRAFVLGLLVLALVISTFLTVVTRHHPRQRAVIAMPGD